MELIKIEFYIGENHYQVIKFTRESRVWSVTLKIYYKIGFEALTHQVLELDSVINNQW